MLKMTLEDISVSFKKVKALRHVSYELKPGITALLGPNGAGKSTLMNVICTLRKPSTGKVYYIVMHLSEETNGLDESTVYQTKRLEEREAISALHNDLSMEESLDYLKTVEHTRWSTDHYLVVLEKVLASEEYNQEHLERLLCSFGVYLQGKEWAYEKFDMIMPTLLSKLGDVAFWTFAEANGAQLSNYNYQTSTRNMQLLFKLMCQEDPTEMETLLIEELHTQRKWVSGDDHFDINYDCEKVVTPFISTPQSFAEMALYILLEQADVQNARKLEIAIYAIYVLGLQFPEIMQTITEQWPVFSQNQMECLLTVIARWAAEGSCSKALHNLLLDEYNDCSELSTKLYLHSILLKLKDPSIEVGTVSCTAPAISYEIPEVGYADEDNCYKGFLSLVERYKGKVEADAIRRCLLGVPSLEEYVEDKYVSDGDSRIPAINTFPGRIFYSKEKCGDWTDIPLAKKKVRLIAPEDPFLLTEMPRMVFDDEWFPNVNAAHDGKSSPELSTSDLRNIAHSHIGEDEIVLAASLWYPWGYKEGTIYTEVSKIDIPIKMERPVEFDASLGNYGLLINEQELDESHDTTIGMGGFSLFNRVCGSLKLCFGNCQVVPTSIWRNLFECEPKGNDPYIWVDSTGQEVLRFERIASPVREVMHEAYIRQPILFRWVCNKTWLTAMLKCENLGIIRFCTQEPYPCLGY